MRFTIGCDPEFMLYNQDTKLLVSAVPIIRGTKKKPDELKHGAIHHDNVNVEVTIKPAKTKIEFIKNISSVLSDAARKVSPLKIMSTASAEFPSSELMTSDARRFGCDRDYDVYTTKGNRINMGLQRGNLRSTGGHIHLGAVNGKPPILLSKEGKLISVKVLDIIIGIPSVLLDKDMSSIKRRSLYGKAGCYRPTPYGVEYRVLSSFWLNSPKVTSLVFDLASTAIKILSDEPKVKVLLSLVSSDKICKAINNSKYDIAYDIFIQTIKFFPKAVFNQVLKISSRKSDFDLYKEWKL